ncbi:Sensory neuron membrane protein 1 [Blattella germanica]|nr:Sensory neuron membrane protein 1 [Blattella germanica]
MEWKGIVGNKYVADLGDPSIDPKLRCYCTTTPTATTCLKRGVHDLQKCKDAPLVFSFPHFFLADAEYRNGVRGLRPRKHIHETAVYLEPLTGTPLQAFKRVQFNVMMRSVRQLEFMKNLPRVIVPLFWLEESVELTEDLTKFLKLVLTLLKILKWVIWILLGVGSIMFSSGFFLIVQKLTKMATVVLGRNSPEVSPSDLQTPPRF